MSESVAPIITLEGKEVTLNGFVYRVTKVQYFEQIDDTHSYSMATLSKVKDGKVQRGRPKRLNVFDVEELLKEKQLVLPTLADVPEVPEDKDAPLLETPLVTLVENE